MISLAKSCPDKSEVKGTPGPNAPGARTAVPMATNSAPPTRGKDPLDSRTPTTPCPPSSPHSAVIRSMAVCLAWPMACTSGPKDPGSPGPETWVADWAGSCGRQVPGQLYPVYPTA